MAKQQLEIKRDTKCNRIHSGYLITPEIKKKMVNIRITIFLIIGS